MNPGVVTFIMTGLAVGLYREEEELLPLLLLLVWTGPWPWVGA